MIQVQTLVSTAVAASTQKALFIASVFKDMRDLAVRWTSMNACLIHAIMMPPVWTRLEDSIASVCQVKPLNYIPLQRKRKKL